MGVRRKGPLGRMRFWLRLFTECVSWLCEPLGGRGDCSRGVVALDFPAFTGCESRDGVVTKQGAQEVLELFLSDSDDEEDEIFVTTLWWSLVVLLLICCIKRLIVIGRVL